MQTPRHTPKESNTQLITKDFFTEESKKLCQMISKRSGGVCFLGFSRGKDSLCSWLYLRNFFKRIIPFHCATVPHLGFVDRSLKYYEKFFDTPIERCLSGTVSHLQYMTYQTLADEKFIEDRKIGEWFYGPDDVADVLREKYNLPKAWCAQGIAISDGWTRAGRLRRLGMAGAIYEKELGFYPCFDWNLDQAIGYIEAHGCKLSPEYLTNDRSFTGLPIAKDLSPEFRRLFPEDYRKIELMYPLIGATVARNEFRKMKYKKETNDANTHSDSLDSELY